jgi:hypothetical protein
MLWNTLSVVMDVDYFFKRRTDFIRKFYDEAVGGSSPSSPGLAPREGGRDSSSRGSKGQVGETRVLWQVAAGARMQDRFIRCFMSSFLNRLGA